MINKNLDIAVNYENKEYTAKMELYMPGLSKELAIKKRKTILILPGGAYGYTSDREAEPIALKFCSAGYNSIVLRYSCFPVTFPISLLQTYKAIITIRENCEKWNVDTNNIIVCGFSAGGHLAACSGALFNLPLVKENLKTFDNLHKPNKLILGYSVITTGEKSHKGSIENLLGDKINDAKLLELLAVEKQVTKETPPTFLWHTFKDNAVDAANSLLFSAALSNNKVPFEMHIFQNGGHGLSLANEVTAFNECSIEKSCEVWIDLAIKWIDNN